MPRTRQDSLFLVDLVCKNCAATFQMRRFKWEWHQKRGTNVGSYCSKSCVQKKWHRDNPGRHPFTPENKKLWTPVVARGFTRTEANRKQISDTLKARGHKPLVRGGNGAGMTKHEALVAPHLTEAWAWNYPVALGEQRPGYPSNYKLDFADPERKVGLEVDGGTHTSYLGKQRDKKKMDRLAELGWKVFRITNTEAARLSTTSMLKEHLTTLLGLKGSGS